MTEILPPHLAIKAMRSSGYRDAVQAIAELVDNSIQAGDHTDVQTIVEVLSVDKPYYVKERKRKRIHQLAVYDNAIGMTAETLQIALQFGNGTRLDKEDQTGIGKFGMGLPNASISQCRRVDVWSWRDGQCLYTYLDIDKIAAGELRDVPVPVPQEVPQEWAKRLKHGLGPHGTLVVWSKLDRVKWKSSKALFDNAEHHLGRIYRYFIHQGDVIIRFASFSTETKPYEPTDSRLVSPNDPMFLLNNTTAPDPFRDEPAFDFFGEETIDVGHGGEKHEVVIRFSMTKPAARKEGGSSKISRLAAKNTGVSVVRAGRELEMNRSFENRYDPRERWWGVEVRFEPALDDIFGVTNNKQAAIYFMRLDIAEDASASGMSVSEYREELQDLQDPRLVMYVISDRIESLLRPIREQIKRMKRARLTKT